MVNRLEQRKKIIKFPNNKPASLGFLEYTDTANISAPINMLKGTSIVKIPNIANGFTIAATILKNVSGIESPKYRKTIINGIIKPSVENTAVITAESVIENILPMIISTEEIFVEIKVSIVPLSFPLLPFQWLGTLILVAHMQ